MEMERSASGKGKSRRARKETHRALLQQFVDIVGPEHAHLRPGGPAALPARMARPLFGARRAGAAAGNPPRNCEDLGARQRDGVGVVPQAGNTGLVGGQIPAHSGAEIVLSVTRLNRVREIDPPAAR